MSTTCIAIVHIGFALTFASSTAGSVAIEMKQFQSLLEEIRQTLSGIIGQGYQVFPHMVTFSSLASGSVIVKGNLGVPSNVSASKIYTGTQNIQSNAVIGPFSIVGSSYTASGFTPT